MSFDRELQPFQVALLENYFKSAMFLIDEMKYVDDSASVVGYKGAKEEIRACLFEYAIFKKKRRHAVFTDAQFFGQTRRGFLFNGKYNEIESVDVKGVVKMCGKNAITITPELARCLMGIYIIYHLDGVEDLSLTKYLFSFEKKIFGEYLPHNYGDRVRNIEKKVGLEGLSSSLLYRLKLRIISLESAEIEIVINDKDLQRASLSEWEKCIDEFVNNDKILSEFQDIFYTTLCVKYRPENIKFKYNGNIKTTFSTRVKNATGVALNVADKASEIFEERVEQTKREYEKVAHSLETQVKDACKNGSISEETAKNQLEKIDKVMSTVAGNKNLSKTTSITTGIKRVKFQPGVVDVAFVFSCPGQKEMLVGHVCAGKTGTNLQILIEYLHSQCPKIFTSASKSSYTITNASDIVHYMALTGDTEASYEEISNQENIDRLSKEISGCMFVICMGDRAAYAVAKTNISSIIIRGEHLGQQNLNRNYKVDGSTAAERNKKRVEIVGNKILQQL